MPEKTKKTYATVPADVSKLIVTSDGYVTINPNKKFAFLCPCCGDYVETGIPPLNGGEKLNPLCGKCTELVRKLDAVGKTRDDLADEFKAECKKRNIELVAEPYHLGGILRKLAEWKEEK